MAANTVPIFTDTPTFGFGGSVLSAANTAKDGTGTTLLVFTAGSDGGIAGFIRARPIGTNTASVLRVFVNNGSTPATAGNNVLFDELALPATTLTEVAAQPVYELPLDLRLPAGFRIYVCLGTAVAAGYQVSCPGGDY